MARILLSIWIEVRFQRLLTSSVKIHDAAIWSLGAKVYVTEQVWISMSEPGWGLGSRGVDEWIILTEYIWDDPGLCFLSSFLPATCGESNLPRDPGNVLEKIERANVQRTQPRNHLPKWATCSDRKFLNVGIKVTKVFDFKLSTEWQWEEYDIQWPSREVETYLPEVPEWISGLGVFAGMTVDRGVSSLAKKTLHVNCEYSRNVVCPAAAVNCRAWHLVYSWRHPWLHAATDDHNGVKYSCSDFLCKERLIMQLQAQAVPQLSACTNIIQRLPVRLRIPLQLLLTVRLISPWLSFDLDNLQMFVTRSQAWSVQVYPSCRQCRPCKIEDAMVCWQTCQTSPRNCWQSKSVIWRISCLI